MLKIEKGIPIPPDMRGMTKGKRKYPFAEMEVGDSILLEQKKASGIGSYAQKCLPGAKFSTRKVEGGIRIWRLA
jgi:hypothetical protein